MTVRAAFAAFADALWAPCRAGSAYALAAVVAAVQVLWLFPLSFLAGHGAFFEQIDASQHISGWLFYARDSWHIPLLKTTRLVYPEGVSIAFTDSLPLAAVPAKLLAAWLPVGFHYFGWWHALAYVANALAAVFLVRALGLRHLLGAFAAAAFAVTWPALLWRLGHTSLLTHAWLLLALGLYFRGLQHSRDTARTPLALGAVCLAALLTHPYLFVLCAAVFAAYLLDQGRAQGHWLRQGLRLAGLLLAVAIVGKLFGYFGNGATTTTGFGEYSMNLDTLVCGGGIFPCVKPDAHAFAAIGFSDATGGQYEGYNYLGLGVLLLLPFACVAAWAQGRAPWRRHAGLLAVALACGVYALSNKVYFGSHLLLSFEVPGALRPITDTFRASGRFFWLPGYLLLAGMLTALLARRSRFALVLLAVALPLQLLDLQPLTRYVRAKTQASESGDRAIWGPLMAQVDVLHLYPRYGCNAGDISTHWFFQAVAARYGKPISSGYVARANIDCAQQAHAFDAGVAPRHLLIMPADVADSPFNMPAALRQLAASGACVRWRASFLCLPGANAQTWREAGLEVQAFAGFAEEVSWPAKALPTQAGRLAGERIVPAAPPRAGVLSYGPYVKLPPGVYRATLRYASEAPAGQAVGRWDVVLNGTGDGAGPLASGTLAGSQGAPASVSARIEVRAEGLLEIRSFIDATGDLQILGITLAKEP